MLIEIHMLKSFPPTNLNRDENGSPKTCYFGGCQRGRISSQSLKHAWRKDSEFAEMPMGIRTRHLPDLVAAELKKQNVQEDCIKAIMPKLTGFGNKDAKESEDLTTAQIMFFAPEDICEVTKLVKEKLEAAQSVENIKKISTKEMSEELKKIARPISMDMALFGRMITDDSFSNVEASMQVAHAISTHPVNMESDFFTAVDDLQAENETGSAMMGDTDFNSCCYYIYAAVDTDQLSKNIAGSPEVQAALPQLLPRLLEAMAFTNPSGKQNSFAGHSLPDLICVEKKKRKVPVSYANAFERPVRSTNGYVEPSINRLADHVDEMDAHFALPVEERLWFSAREAKAPQKAQQVQGMPEILDIVGKWLGGA